MANIEIKDLPTSSAAATDLVPVSVAGTAKQSTIASILTVHTAAFNHAAYLDATDIGTNVQAYDAILAATTASFLAADETKLDAIEAAATADQTGAEIKVAYELEADTNAYDDAAVAKVAATSGTNTGDEVLATIAVAGVVIKSTIAEADTGTDNTHYITPAILAGTALATKVAGVEASADVTDETNVKAALDGATVTAITGATGDGVLVQDATASNGLRKVLWENLPAGGGGGISNVVEDTTPQLGGNLDVQTFLVDGRDIATDGTKLDGVEAGATADQSNAEIETGYNTQVGVVSQAAAEAGVSTTPERFTPQRIAQAIAALEGNTVSTEQMRDQVAEVMVTNGTHVGITAVDNDAADAVDLTVTVDADDVSDAATVNKYTTAAEISKLAAIEAAATADQTGAQIKVAYEAETNTNAFTDALSSKLTAIEAAADVTDATNVDAAGATMNTDASVSANTWVLDEDTMSSDSATKVPTQQSVKKYVDDESTGATGVVVHGATAGTARPAGYGQMLWIGSVDPTNAAANDLLVRTDEAV